MNPETDFGAGFGPLLATIRGVVPSFPVRKHPASPCQLRGCGAVMFGVFEKKTPTTWVLVCIGQHGPWHNGAPESADGLNQHAGGVGAHDVLVHKVACAKCR